jgi:hypothetical protein
MKQPSSDEGRDSAASDPERRRYQRYAVRCSCWLERAESALYATTADIGRGGLFLRTAVPVPHGTSVDVVLDLEGDLPRVLAEGIVTRAVPRRRGVRHGVGVEFTRIHGGEDALLRYLGERPRPQA